MNGLTRCLAFSYLPKPSGKGIFSDWVGGGGSSVTGGDTCIREGLQVSSLSPKTLAWLNKTVPKAGSIAGNPLDDWRVFGDPHYLGDLLDQAYQDPSVAMVVIDRLITRKAFHSFDDSDPTPLVIDMMNNRQYKKPTVFTVDSEGGDPILAAKGATMRSRFGNAGIPAFPSLQRAARSLFLLYEYHRRIEEKC